MVICCYETFVWKRLVRHGESRSSKVVCCRPCVVDILPEPSVTSADSIRWHNITCYNRWYLCQGALLMVGLVWQREIIRTAVSMLFVRTDLDAQKQLTHKWTQNACLISYLLNRILMCPTFDVFSSCQRHICCPKMEKQEPSWIQVLFPEVSWLSMCHKKRKCRNDHTEFCSYLQEMSLVPSQRITPFPENPSGRSLRPFEIPFCRSLVLWINCSDVELSFDQNICSWTEMYTIGENVGGLTLWRQDVRIVKKCCKLSLGMLPHQNLTATWQDPASLACPAMYLAK